MAETKVAKKTKKSKESIQETEVKLNENVKETTAVADDVKVVEDNVQVDVEIDCRSCSNSSNQCVYIRRKRSI